MDFLSILLPVIINLITLGVALIGLFIGIKNGVKFQFLKLFLFAGAVVGMYFLTPVINTLIAIDVKIIFSVLVALAYILITLVITILRVKADKEKAIEVKTQKIINSAKPIKGIKSRKKVSAQIKQALERPALSKIFGAIFGIIIGVALVFVAYLPLRPMIVDFADSQGIETLNYTLVEQIENTGIEDILVNLNEGE